MLKAQCHCRECQYITGGAPKTFTRGDLDKPVTREFCADCGTHIVTFRKKKAVPATFATSWANGFDNCTSCSSQDEGRIWTIESGQQAVAAELAKKHEAVCAC